MDLLEKKKFGEFVNKLDLPQDLEDTDDLSVLVSNGNRADAGPGGKMLNKNLFLFVCSVAGESISKQGMSANDQLLEYYTQFQFWMDCLHEKAEFSGGILRLFEGKKLPESFHKHVRAMKTNPTAKWIKDHGLQKKGLQMQQNMKFGAIVKANYDAAKRDINGSANPLFISKEMLPSGTSEYGYYYFMRKQFWPARA